ncbi:hypothetical protein HY629_02945 [Candidatus Uhrbacteria bacterium]|nr:hypothetical protein [Candidatus Uhrbacteria bacterium]
MATATRTQLQEIARRNILHVTDASTPQEVEDQIRRIFLHWQSEFGMSFVLLAFPQLALEITRRMGVEALIEAQQGIVDGRDDCFVNWALFINQGLLQSIDFTGLALEA